MWPCVIRIEKSKNRSENVAGYDAEIATLFEQRRTMADMKMAEGVSADYRLNYSIYNGMQFIALSYPQAIPRDLLRCRAGAGQVAARLLRSSLQT